MSAFVGAVNGPSLEEMAYGVSVKLQGAGQAQVDNLFRTAVEAWWPRSEEVASA